jgi:hypothetical protein
MSHPTTLPRATILKESRYYDTATAHKIGDEYNHDYFAKGTR